MNRDLPICFLDSDDAELEHLIQALGEALKTAYPQDRALALTMLSEMTAAIKARSPGQIERMEARYFPPTISQGNT